MKIKLLISIVVFALFILPRTTFGKVPAKVENAFHAKYPAITEVKWEKEKGNYEANFHIEGKKTSILIDTAGKIMETEVAIAMSELPENAKSYLNTNRKGMKIKETSKITLSDGSIRYEAAVNGKDLLFDQTGKFLKETKD